MVLVAAALAQQHLLTTLTCVIWTASLFCVALSRAKLVKSGVCVSANSIGERVCT